MLQTAVGHFVDFIFQRESLVSRSEERGEVGGGGGGRGEFSLW